MYSVMIKNGKIISGKGNPWYYGDIAIQDDKIAKIGFFPEEVQAEKVIDAKGLYVVPGFIDGHSHSDLYIFTQPFAEQKVMQGITTEIVGMDGMSVAPIKEEDVIEWRKHLSGLDGDPEIDWTWKSFADYLDAVDFVRPSDNIGSYVGLGTIRLHILGMTNRKATKYEIKKMKDLILRSIAEGARGISAGLVYPPGSYQDQEELIELASAVRDCNLAFNIHLRSESNYLLSAIQEVIEIAQVAGTPIIITHFKVMGRENWGLAKEAIQLVSNARQVGIDVTMEQYPYTAASTMLHAVIPPWYHTQGAVKLIETMKKEPQLIKKDIYQRNDWENYFKISGWENIYVSSVESEQNKIFEGKNLAEIAKMRSREDPADATLELLREEELAVGMIAYVANEEEIAEIMQHPAVSIVTDGLLGGKPHPRVYGSFPRILGRYVREKKILSLEEAIRKMTSLPAEKLRLKCKGIIAEGYDADITLFNLETIADKGTYDDPRQFPVGIKWVLVNGKVVIAEGKHLQTRTGKTVRE